jgi:hypothetical protein
MWCLSTVVGSFLSVEVADLQRILILLVTRDAAEQSPAPVMASASAARFGCLAPHWTRERTTR